MAFPPPTFSFNFYRFLWSNGPKECLEFGDYTFDEHFKKPIPSFPPREVLRDYIIGRARKTGMCDKIRFCTVVRSVTYSENSGKFTVVSENLKEGTKHQDTFDNVVVATGHFSSPIVPYFKGFETFPGRVMHAHDFRNACEFIGQNILVIGGSYSAEDIALQCYKFGAKSVTISYRTKAMGFSWPESIREVPLLDKMEGNVAHFINGEKIEFDAVILCTGYRLYFPFLEEDLCLKARNRLYPPLYKGVLWPKNPKLAYIGMQDQFYTFTMFDAQAWYVRDVILGKILVPDTIAMNTDIAKWTKEEEALLRNPLKQIDFQTKYVRDISNVTDYPKVDWDLICEMFKKWEHDKDHSILGYRDVPFKSAITGTNAKVHHTPWIKAMDDTLEMFLATETEIKN